MRAVVVAGSSLSGELDGAALAAADLLVAVDAGADAVARAGLVPKLLVGDMDSVDPRTRKAFEGAGVEVVLLPVAKDETDLEAALQLVVDRGADEITVYGALGGPRLDHLLGNVLLLTSPCLDGVPIRLVDHLHEVFLARGEAQVMGEPGDTVSLLPLSGEVREVRTEGLLYPLASETLVRSRTRSISNQMTGPVARVTHGEGDLLLVHYLGGWAKA
jgi:thiamine pyrophosphokinase